MDEVRVEVGVKESFMKKLVNGTLKCAGHVERIEDEKRAEIRCQERRGENSRGRSRIRWGDCVKRGLERVGGEWRTTAKNRRSWRLGIEKVVRKK